MSRTTGEISKKILPTPCVIVTPKKSSSATKNSKPTTAKKSSSNPKVPSTKKKSSSKVKDSSSLEVKTKKITSEKKCKGATYEQTGFEVQSIFDTNSYPTDSINFDDDDVFQCGRCKNQFTTLSIFMQHKKENACNSGNSLLLTSQNPPIHHLTTTTVPVQQEELNTPLVLNDADILSLSAYQEQNAELQDIDPTLVTNEEIPFESLTSHINLPTLTTNNQLIFTPTEVSLSLNNFQSNNNNNNNNNNIKGSLNQPKIILENTELIDDSNRVELLESSISKKMIKDVKSYELLVEDLVTDPEVVECLNSVSDNTQNANIQFLQIEPSDTLNITTASLLENPNQITQIQIVSSDTLGLTNSLNCSDSLDNSPKLIIEESPKRKTKKKKEPNKTNCPYCDKEFTKNFDLRQHVRSHTGEKPYQCVICGRAFAQKSNVRKHLNTHKVWPKQSDKTLPPLANENQNPFLSGDNNNGKSNNEITSLYPSEIYACQYCPKQFTNYHTLRTHQKVHANVKVYQCFQKNCNTIFPDLSSLLKHCQTHSKDSKYHCFECGEEYNSLEELGVHQYTHIGRMQNKSARRSPKKYVCPTCKSKFVSPEALDQHLAKCTHDYTCSKCGRTFLCERFLRRHLLSHTPKYMFPCQECHKCFGTENSLKNHMKIHRGEKPFQCIKCSSSFSRNDQLQRHMLVHETVKKYKCPYKISLGCPREFKRKDKLKHHIRTHIQTCTQCNRTFSKSILLRNHERFVHNGKNCIHCDEKFHSSHKCTKASAVHKRLYPATTTNKHKLKISTSNSENKTDGVNYVQVEEEESSDDPSEVDVPTIEIIVMPMQPEDKEIPTTAYPTIFQPVENVNSESRSVHERPTQKTE